MWRRLLALVLILYIILVPIEIDNEGFNEPY
ncbi:MAG: hypothetical protein H6Q66_637 [Firmicutes bacterium]|nr:hypothetical protein [Bacillota bacterium]